MTHGIRDPREKRCLHLDMLACTCDRPLTRAQLAAVNALSSHIDASSTHALVEYQWGNFKHDPLQVLHKFFDGFLYWANWGAPELALRFPHGILPVDLLGGYELDEVVTFTRTRGGSLSGDAGSPPFLSS